MPLKMAQNQTEIPNAHLQSCQIKAHSYYYLAIALLQTFIVRAGCGLANGRVIKAPKFNNLLVVLRKFLLRI